MYKEEKGENLNISSGGRVQGVFVEADAFLLERLFSIHYIMNRRFSLFKQRC